MMDIGLSVLRFLHASFTFISSNVASEGSMDDSVLGTSPHSTSSIDRSGSTSGIQNASYSLHSNSEISGSETIPLQYQGDWPHLTVIQIVLMISCNAGSLLFAIILLRCIWKPPTDYEIRRNKELEVRVRTLQRAYGTYDDVLMPVELIEGETAGDYSTYWVQTFDMAFLLLMIFSCCALAIWTEKTQHELWSDYMFWLMQLPKLAAMIVISVIGGLVCRWFCLIDEKGYIITSASDNFKVNYTRKLQHFAAYLIPLLWHSSSNSPSTTSPLALAWGNWFTLLAFLLLIKPIRESCTFFMLQFNSLDRPEDRPHTLKWIIGGNIIPGIILIIFFRWLYSSYGQQDMVYIFVFITGVGDGFAEPVGVYFGKHRYWVNSCFGDRKYQRSWEGSACVFISSLVFVSCFWYTFESVNQFWLAMIILPPSMTYCEAKSPHTMDTPFLMSIGGLLLFLISHAQLRWVA